jgi:hypothetical protein
MDDLGNYDAFATAEDFATYARRDLSGADTASVEMFLAAASAEIRRYCEWQIWPQLVDDELEIDGKGGPLLVLPVRLLAGVTSITENGTALVDTDYEWSRNGVIEKTYGRWWTRRRRGINAVVTHGYVTSPADLSLLSCQLVGRVFVGALPVAQQQAGAVSVRLAARSDGTMPNIEITANDQQRLVPFRGGYR